MLNLLTVNDLAALLHLSPATIRSNLTRCPDRLPPRVPGVTVLLWHPEIVDKWARGELPAKRTNVGRPRKIV